MNRAELAAVRFGYTVAGDVRLHVAQCGIDQDDTILLLHGFPEFWYGWRHQIEFLAAHGYRVWAPDQRGYNLSDKPRGIGAYTIDALAEDVLGLIHAAGASRVHVVGHDWGAAVAWWVALRFPEHVKKLVIMNVPHPAVMRRFLRSSPSQLLRSWYVFFFQLPWLPERTAAIGNWGPLIHGMKSSSRLNTFSSADFARYRTAWNQPQAMQSMMHWYRAAVRTRPVRLPSERITPPTLILWGARDKFLRREMAQPSADLCDNGRLVVLDGASHWLHHEEPERINALILDHLR